MRNKAINSEMFAIAKGMIKDDVEIIDAYVHNKWLVLQLPTCRFRVPN